VVQRLVEADPAVLAEGKISGTGPVAGKETTHDTADKMALHAADRIRRDTGASIGLATMSETVPGLPSTTLWVAISSKASAAITTLLLAQAPEVNKQRAVHFALDQLRRFITPRPS
jgi:nicotinamide mononucleotide (NMN) deamidase PncC